MGPGRLEVPQLRQRGQGLLRKRHHDLAHDGRFVRMQADDEIAFANRFELVYVSSSASEL
jgi:hypothetical protein